MEFWQVFILINAIAALFLIWPTLQLARRYQKELRVSSRIDTNTEVHAGHLKELEQTLIRGEIDEDELKVLKRDLEKTLVEENAVRGEDNERPIIASFRSRIPVIALVFALPAFSFVLYSYLGSKNDWEIYRLATERREAPASELPELTDTLLSSLQDRLKQRPENTHNWYLLAATAIDKGDYDEGVRAFRELLALEPEAAIVKAELAQALFLRAGNTVTPEARKYTMEALELDANIPTALGLAGIDSYQSGDYKLAIEFWNKALVQLNPSSQAAQVLAGGIEQAKVALAKTGQKPEESATDLVAGPSLTVQVSIDKSKVKVDDSDAVFIYARAWQGPKMPLAIKKLQVSDLPTTITLDQSMSMTSGMDLSTFPQVEIVARITRSGSAISQSGDWQATHGPVIVANQNKTIKITISEQITD